MRMIFLMAAAALTVAAPAVAQNTTADTNATMPADNMAVDANAVVATDNAVVDANMPADVPVTEDVTTAPAPAEKKDFPWGVLGLIGLVGLLGRKRG
jgi:hypothetical protein